ncbi:MAG: tRNA pseudouridine(55) synthase TruB [Spirochaetota bacterium]
MNGHNGLLLIDKPQGSTSFKIVNTIRKQLNLAKAGHAGTLDRFAEGLLVVLTGKMTRLAPFFTGLEKEYLATFRFGVETDTLDPEGHLIAESEIPSIDVIREKIKTFQGKIKQQPPVFSAVHVNGERAYKLARKGKKIDLPEREVFIKGFSILGYAPPDLDVKIRCSKGTYIRSLARDLSRACCSRAYVASLQRISVGPFSLNEAVAVEDIIIERDLRTGAECFSGLPMVKLCEVKNKYIKDILNGKPIQDSFLKEQYDGTGYCALFTGEKKFLALTYRSSGGFSYNFVGGMV